MKPLNSRAVSESLESYAGNLLAESAFFSALSAGDADPGHVRDLAAKHVRVWDDVHYTILGTENALAS